MRFLFLHPVFPGQFHRIMAALARDPAHEVVHCSRESAQAGIPGVKRVRYKVPDAPGEGAATHAFALRTEQAVRHGLAVLEAVRALQGQGFVPDLICGYAGWGPTLFMKDIHPKVPLLGYFEWFMNPTGSEYNFDPAHPLAFEAQLALRTSNAPMLLDLQACDRGVTPTFWQKRQFPAGLRDRLDVLHDGVDTARFCPAPEPAGLSLPGLELPPGTEIVTYATRGMEPFRGFPEFMRALPLLQRRRPHCHAVILGTEEAYYSRAPQGARSYKELLLRELDGQIDLSRVHFAGWCGDEAYRATLRASSAHVYLSYPYVLSWSLLEAMASGCAVVGSRTAPVEEVIADGENGWLVDFLDHEALADRIEQVLCGGAEVARVRAEARRTVLERYDLARLLPRHLAMMGRLAGRSLV